MPTYFHFDYSRLSPPSSQLEQKCFSQQEQLEALQEQMEREREASGSKLVNLEREQAVRTGEVRLTPEGSAVTKVLTNLVYETVCIKNRKSFARVCVRIIASVR